MSDSLPGSARNATRRVKENAKIEIRNVPGGGWRELHNSNDGFHRRRHHAEQSRTLAGESNKEVQSEPICNGHSIGEEAAGELQRAAVFRGHPAGQSHWRNARRV